MQFLVEAMNESDSKVEEQFQMRKHSELIKNQIEKMQQTKNKKEIQKQERYLSPLIEDQILQSRHFAKIQGNETKPNTRNENNMLLQDENDFTGEFKQETSEFMIGLKHSPYLKKQHKNVQPSLGNSPNVKISIPAKDEAEMSFGTSFIKVKDHLKKEKSGERTDVNVASLLSLEKEDPVQMAIDRMK